mgnify:FL=1
MKRLIAVLLTICIAAGLPVAAFAENGPSSGEWSSAWIQLIQGEEAQLLFSSSEPAVEVAGAAYDRETNTITLTSTADTGGVCVYTRATIPESVKNDAVSMQGVRSDFFRLL